MENKKDIIENLEVRFVKYHNEMDKAIGNHESDKAKVYATLACEIANIIAMINNTNEERETERIYNKYDLWKF